MSNKSFLTVVLTAVMLFKVPAVQAHPLFNEDASWLAGFIHPLLGLDHVLALLAVGLWAAQQGGSRLWQLPVAFLSVMTLGAYSGYAGVSLPQVEMGVTGSLLLLGIMLALAARLSTLPSLLLVGFFALFHGYAHSMGISANMAVIDYTNGFLLASVVLLGMGVALGMWARVGRYDQLLRISGLAIGATGGWLCI